MAKKKMTIEELAGMVKRGFDNTATKGDLKRLEDIIKVMDDRISNLEDDVHDIKITMGPLVRMVVALESDMKSLSTRVNRLERKAGFSR